MKRLKSLAATVAAFVKKYKAVIIGQGIWTTASWIYDNPIWWLAELNYGAIGVSAMVIGAMLINFSALLYYRRKKVSWLGWDQGAEALKKKEQWLRKNAIRICLGAIVIISIVLYVPNEIPWQVIPVSTVIAFAAGIFAAFLKVKMAEDAFALLVLSIIEDSFIATAYLRHGCTDGLKSKDMMLFLASSLISTLYWAIRNGVIIEIIVRPLTKA